MLDKSVQHYEDDGFSVQPVKKKKVPVKKAIEPPKLPEKPKERLIAVVENGGVLAETQKSNKVMQMAIMEIVKTLKNMDNKPKKLECRVTERDTRGFLNKFEVVVVE